MGWIAFTATMCLYISMHSNHNVFNKTIVLYVGLLWCLSERVLECSVVSEIMKHLRMDRIPLWLGWHHIHIFLIPNYFLEHFVACTRQILG